MRERLVYCPAPHRCNITLRPNSTEACGLKPCTQWKAEDWEQVGHTRLRLPRNTPNSGGQLSWSWTKISLRVWLCSALWAAVEVISSGKSGVSACRILLWCQTASVRRFPNQKCRESATRRTAKTRRVGKAYLQRILNCLGPFLSLLTPHTGPVCRKNTMSSRFCDKLKLLGRCSLRSVQKQCCFTCGF